MKLLVLSHADVEEMLPMRTCVQLMREALASLARGEYFQPLRSRASPPDVPGGLATMPAYRGAPRPYFGLKEICVFPNNSAIGLDSHQGLVLLHDGKTGQPLAAMNASAITAIRTAAVTAIATDVLAPPRASRLALVGAGVQARSHLEALVLVRALTEIRICSRTGQSAQALVAEARARGLPARVDSVEAAVRQSDIVVTVTSSLQPVVFGEWLAPGTHVNAVGASTTQGRELDSRALACSSLFVDLRESTENESADYMLARDEGAIGPNHIRAELGEVLVGSAIGRTRPDEITLFRSQGLAVEDLACASYLFEAAGSKWGTWVNI